MHLLTSELQTTVFTVRSHLMMHTLSLCHHYYLWNCLSRSHHHQSGHLPHSLAQEEKREPTGQRVHQMGRSHHDLYTKAKVRKLNKPKWHLPQCALLHFHGILEKVINGWENEKFEEMIKLQKRFCTITFSSKRYHDVSSAIMNSGKI